MHADTLNFLSEGKPVRTKNIDVGFNVIFINERQILFTGNHPENKFY